MFYLGYNERQLYDIIFFSTQFTNINKQFDIFHSIMKYFGCQERFLTLVQCQKLGKNFLVLCTSYFWALWWFQIFAGPLFKKKTTSTDYCLTQWISKLPGSFEIHWVRQYSYLVNFMGLVGRVNSCDYKTKPIFTCLRHGKVSQFLTLSVFPQICW